MLPPPPDTKEQKNSLLPLEGQSFPHPSLLATDDAFSVPTILLYAEWHKTEPLSLAFFHSVWRIWDSPVLLQIRSPFLFIMGRSCRDAAQFV